MPSNRPEIYKECATLMFEKWDQRRDIIFKIPVDFELLDLFSFLANKIFGSAENEDGVSKDWLLTEVRVFSQIGIWTKQRRFKRPNLWLILLLVGHGS